MRKLKIEYVLLLFFVSSCVKPSESPSKEREIIVQKAEGLVTENSMTSNIDKIVSVKDKELKNFYLAQLVNPNSDNSYSIQQIRDVIDRSNDAPYIGTLKGRYFKSELNDRIYSRFRWRDGTWFTVDEFGYVEFSIGSNTELIINDYCTLKIGMNVEEVEKCFPIEYESRTANEIRYHGISFGLHGTDQIFDIQWSGDKRSVNSIVLTFPT